MNRRIRDDDDDDDVIGNDADDDADAICAAERKHVIELYL